MDVLNPRDRKQIKVYNKHNGPVTSISPNPFKDRLFLTASADGSIRLYDVQDVKQVMIFEPKYSEYILCVQWSPVRPAVFVAVSDHGTLYNTQLVFDADGAYCMEEAALMSRVNVENCIRDSANPARTRRPQACIAPRHRRDSPVDATHRSPPPQEEEGDVPPKYQALMDRIIQKKPKPKGPAPTVTVVDSEGSFEEYIGRPL